MGAGNGARLDPPQPFQKAQRFLPVSRNVRLDFRPVALFGIILECIDYYQSITFFPFLGQNKEIGRYFLAGLSVIAPTARALLSWIMKYCRFFSSSDFGRMRFSVPEPR